MRICLDIQPAVVQRAGVGRYTRALAQYLPAFANSDHITLWYFDFRRRGEDPALTSKCVNIRAIRWFPGRAVRYAWKVWNWPPLDWFLGPADLFHFPNFVRSPLRRGRSVTTIHDVSFLRFPEHAEPANLAYLRSRIKDTVIRSDAILTDSAFSADEIADTLGVPRHRIFPTPLGLDPGLGPPASDRIATDRAALGLEKPYLLHVGTLEPRKNLVFLVKVFDRLTSFDGQLVLAGMRGWKIEPLLAAIRAARRASDIRVLDYVPECRLPGLYAGAELMVFPSLYEGFGLPPLEAMACGAPVLASAIPVLREVLGSAADLVPGFDPDAWTHAITTLLADADRRNDLRRRGFARAARFTWQETARLTWDVYRKVAS